MASNLSSNTPLSKGSTQTSQVSSPATSQSGIGFSGDGHSQRRSGGSGSFGAGQQTRASTGAIRTKQGSRNQTKTSRRYRLTDEDTIAESAAMRPFTNRKGQTSITHLMNFSLPPRPSNSHYHNSNNRNSRVNPSWGLGSGYHAVDKARYVHANYRFIVDPRRSYHAQSVDADEYLEWDSVLQILASPQSQAAACPICLGDPVAPRMAKCGHIFCLHCLIRYMHSEDANHSSERRARYKACPICWDSIYMSDVRPLRWYIGQESAAPVEGGDIVLSLVMRPINGILALPKEDSSALAPGEDIPWQYAAGVMDFARVMKGSEMYMKSHFDDEIAQLEQLEKHDELMFGEDTEWTGKAIKGIKDMKEKMRDIGNPPPTTSKPQESKIRKRPMGQNVDIGDTQQAINLEQFKASSQIALDPQGPDNYLPSTIGRDDAIFDSYRGPSRIQVEQRPKSITTPPSTGFYFYQALLHYYLSPLDIRILKAAFGDYSSFPLTILPRVERISTGHVVDDDLRKRAKYLAHLPRGCEVNFLECDWNDTVPQDVLSGFETEIDRRRKKNSDKEAREEKERLRAEREEEDKRYAHARRRVADPSADKIKADDFTPLMENTSVGFESTSPVWASRKANGSSFASLASPSTSPSTARTVWGTTAVIPSSPTLPAIPLEIQSRDDGWLQGWEDDLLQEDDLVTQVEAISLAESSKAGASSAKKRKGKKITLMTTTARRGA